MESGAYQVSVYCQACGEVGHLRDKRVVDAILAGARPRRFRCTTCGMFTPGDRASLTVSWICPYTLEIEDQA